MHSPITFQDISLIFPHKLCFEKFSYRVYPGERIAIMGRNGSGKTSLIQLLLGLKVPSSGQVVIAEHISIGYVEQTISDFNHLSGGQRFNKRLSQALSQSPEVLILDEPTNHLDLKNRKGLLKMLSQYRGTLLVISHDEAVLRGNIDTFWYLDRGQVHCFRGSYDDYIDELTRQKLRLQEQLTHIKKEEKRQHQGLMKEQQRAAKSRQQGKKHIDQKKWPTVVSHAKAHRAETTTGKKQQAVRRKRKQLEDQLSQIPLPEKIHPSFSFKSSSLSGKSLLSIHGADIGYNGKPPVLKNISLALSGGERVAIVGNNGCGKSTLLKAIYGKDEVTKTGDWYVVNSEHIGYLDQHYSNLNPSLSVFEHVKAQMPSWDIVTIRAHLKGFLFRKNEEVYQPVTQLSGGEKARLALSLIAANTPKLLILDEITNNLDLETKQHVIQVLKAYPGAMLIVSHEATFLDALGVDCHYAIDNRKFLRVKK